MALWPARQPAYTRFLPGLAALMPLTGFRQVGDVIPWWIRDFTHPEASIPSATAKVINSQVVSDRRAARPGAGLRL